MQTKTKSLTVIAMLSALAYIVLVVGRVPIVLFLKYEPKDVIITIGGFLFGPLASFAMSVIVSFVEMLTISETGPIGLMMNIISTCSFACTAAFIYKKIHSFKGAVIGLTAGGLIATGVMILWNLLITPIYMGLPREAVVELLIPAFLPFNLVKGGLNAALTMLIYKPLVVALRKSNLLPPATDTVNATRKINIGAILISSFIIITCVMVILVLQKII